MGILHRTGRLAALATTALATTALTLGLATAAGAAETPRRGGTLTFAVTAEPPNYDCHANTSFAFIHPVAPHYSLLLKFDPSNYPKITGDLAESWTVSDDGLTFTFKLHPNVKFHDGSALTARDVKASYERIINPPKGVVSARQATFDAVASVETPDPQTVVFKLKGTDASFLANLASPWNCVYSADKLAADPKFPEKTVMGSGPFRFGEHVSGSHWTGQRFDGYFRQGEPYLDGFRAVFMSSSAVTNALQGGQVQAEFRGLAPADRDRVKNGAGDKVQVHEAPWLASLILVFNAKKKPFDDPRVRRALSLAIDRWQASTALAKISILGPVGGILRPGYELAASEAELTKMPGFGKDIKASRDEAMRLLREAGVTGLTVTLTNRNVNMPYTIGGVYVIDQLRQIGVTVKHDQLETKLWQSAMSGGNYDMAIDFTGDFMDDPSLNLTKYLSTEISPVNYSGQADPLLDKLYSQQRGETDKAKRAQLVREFERRAMEQAYVVPILWWNRSVVLSSDVRGWEMTPSHYLNQDLADVWLAK